MRSAGFVVAEGPGHSPRCWSSSGYLFQSRGTPRTSFSEAWRDQNWRNAMVTAIQGPSFANPGPAIRADAGAD